MERMVMKDFMMVVLSISFFFFLFPSLAVSRELCLGCHGNKNMPAYVDLARFRQSVHGFLGCVQCHVGVSGYPHGLVSKVKCGICHFFGRGAAPREQAVEYKMSVHGRVSAAGNAAAPTCQTCHGSHDIYASADARSSTNRRKIPALCARCHPREFDVYQSSIHGRQFLSRDNTGAATCFDCHLEHLTPAVTSVSWQLSLIRECGTCHAEKMKTYRETYHGKITELGYATAAKCSDCHGAHGILRVENPASTLAPKNILATCRKCHPKATAGFTRFYAHPDETDRKDYPVLFYTYLFMTTLLIGVFSFFFLHTFLWAYRSLKERIRRKEVE